MNGPTGYNVRFRRGPAVGYATVTLRVCPSTLHNALTVFQALRASNRDGGPPALYNLEIWRSGEKVNT